MTAEAYGQQLGQLLPPGAAWAQHPESHLRRLLLALGESLARAHQRSDDLFRETDPQQTSELLDRWEVALGLPDACSVQGSQTVAERVQLVVAKLISAGGQSRAYFTALAVTLGYPTATVTEYQARRHGRARLGQPYGGEDWEEAWQLNLPDQQAGDTRLECIVSRDKPAGSIILFNYGAT